MNTWYIDANAGKVGYPSICCGCSSELHLENKPEYIQIEHEGNVLSFLTWDDILVIDEVNECRGKLIDAVYLLKKSGDSYHESDANVTIVKL